MIHFKTIIFLFCTVFVLLIASCDPAKTSNDLPSTIDLPVITTTEPIAIIATTATSGGTITADGGAKVGARGVCWSVTATPTIADAHTRDSVGVGTYTSYITGLVAGTVYNVRAYATNSKGTVYGNVYSFTSGGTVTDIDGNVYHTVTIGTQTWMVENLKTTKYRNGDLIGSNAYNDEEESMVAKYGRHYDWNAVSANLNIAPIGWHVSSDAEWTILENYISIHYGNSLSTAKALASTTGWESSSNTGSIGNYQSVNNFSGFSALPAAFIIRNSMRQQSFTGILYTLLGLGKAAYWWTCSEGGYKGPIWFMSYQDFSMQKYNDPDYLLNFYSVRCVKDPL